VPARGKEGSKQTGPTSMLGPIGQVGEESQGLGTGQCAEEQEGKANMAGDDIDIPAAKIGKLDTESAKNITCSATTQPDEQDERTGVGRAMETEINRQEGTAEGQEGKERRGQCFPPPPP
jgi:hypothetical protein